MHNHELLERRKQVQEERMMLLINDSKLRESYFGQARDYLESLEYGSSS